MTVFHSGHLFHLPKHSGQPYRGQKTLITVNIFSAIFFDDSCFPTIFSDTNHIIKSAKRRSATFFKALEPKKPIHAPPTRLFSLATWIPHADAWGRVAHFLVPSFYQQACLAPSCTSTPPSVLSELCFSIFLAFQPPPTTDGNSLPWPRPVCALGRPLFHLQSLFSFVWVPTY